MPICVLQHIIYRNMLYITLPWCVDSAWKDSITSNAFCYIVGSDGFCQADHCSLWCWVCTTKWNSFWRGTQRYLQIIYNSYSAQNTIWDIPIGYKKILYDIYDEVPMELFHKWSQLFAQSSIQIDVRKVPGNTCPEFSLNNKIKLALIDLRIPVIYEYQYWELRF